MTTRRHLNLLAGAAALISACAPPPSPAPMSALQGDVGPVLLVSTLRGNEVRAFGSDGVDLGAIVAKSQLPRRFRDRPFEPSSARLVDDELWVSNFATGDVHAFDLDGRWVRTAFVNGGPVRIEEPAVIQRCHGKTWVLGNDTRNLVGMVDGLEPEEVGAGQSLFNHVHGLAFAGGLALVGTSPVTRELGLVQIWDVAANRLIGDFGIWGELEEATGLAMDGDTVLVADFFAGDLSRWDPWTGERLETLAGEEALDRPIAVEVALDGAIWVLDAAGVVRVEAAESVRVVTFEEPGVAFARGLTLVE